MAENIERIVLDIDSIIRQHLWFDFHVLSYDGRKLVIAGSEDLDYYHTLEVIFENVFFFKGYFDGWMSDTSAPVFILEVLDTELNGKYEITQGNRVFIFRTEDYRNDVIIAAGSVSYNTDTVFYYQREDLKENERIADFVKRDEA
ncbi:hypothetical protein [Chitinophaga filiformis]|uniref:Uncharacterized protein n=1 Tax=Chitinophaga filiformis TaxID=104663 RepID=A0A1G7H1X8_CHIFI|nr:hypothetical protein [Chitinophaga filiformis]SDE94442.1 hypothetical protein SAMN04488121_101271 [Chitinophaga filiformis]